MVARLEVRPDGSQWAVNQNGENLARFKSKREAVNFAVERIADLRARDGDTEFHLAVSPRGAPSRPPSVERGSSSDPETDAS